MSTGEAQPLHLLNWIPQAKDVLSLPSVWLEFTYEEIPPFCIHGISPPDPWTAGDTVSVKVYKPFLNLSSGWAWECVRLCRLSSLGNIMTQQWDLHQNRVLCASEAVPKKMAIEELRFFQNNNWRVKTPLQEQLPEHMQNNAGVGCEQALPQWVDRRGQQPAQY